MKKVHINCFIISILGLFLGSWLNVNAQKYTDYGEAFEWSDMVANPVNGYGSIIAEIYAEPGMLVINIDISFSTSPLKTGNIFYLSTKPQLPDMVIGELLPDYIASIKDGYLHITGSGNSITGVSKMLVADLSNFGNVYAETNENYILSYSPQTEVKTEGKLLSKLITELEASIQYFDGLGRPKQTIAIASSPDKKDVIQNIVYDPFGRESHKLLPYVLTDENNKGNISAISAPTDVDYTSSLQYQFYNNSNVDNIVNSTAPYSQTVFENSPLNRVLAQGAPGTDWQPTYDINGNPTFSGHTVKIEYATNGTADVRRFSVYNGQLKNEAYYEPEQLYKTVTKDENWTDQTTDLLDKLNTTEEYKDKLGQVVLKRSYVDTSKIEGVQYIASVETYYVYDDFGLLRFVLPPEAVKTMFDGSSPTEFVLIDWDKTLNDEEEGVSGYMIAKGGSLTLLPGYNFKATTQKRLSISAGNALGDLIYAYKYDGRKRMTEKKIPGAASVYMVYDDRDRLVATQDGEMRSENRWFFTKYDAFNRPVMTGILQSGGSHSYLQAVFRDFDGRNDALYEHITNTGNIGYTLNESFPTSLNILESYLLTVTYYDDYEWLGDQSAVDVYYNDLKSQFASHGFGVAVPLINKFDRVKGQVTGTKERVLDDTNTWLNTVTFYDDRYRPILFQSDNYVGGEDIALNEYDFPGKLLESWTCHTTSLSSPGKEIIRQKYNYDHAGRLLSNQQQMTEAPTLVTVSENSYNELGQLINKKVGNGVQEMDYKYNIRGWLTQINDPENVSADTKKYAMKLHYNDTIGALSPQAQYNGNISAIEWRTPGSSGGSSNVKQGYGFSYDALDRLQTSVYDEGAYNTVNRNRYNESITGYDYNGNIQGLIRHDDNQEIDRLTYYYDSGGNQLSRVTDKAPIAIRSQGFLDGNKNGIDYSYDLNGNMTQDKNKGIDHIEYNHLNLPVKLTGNNKTIEYIYSANGQKLQKKTLNETTHYSASFIYEGSSLKQILHDEGYIDMSGSPTYHYYLKDHLGNNRMVVNQVNTVVQQTDYYPFGMAFNKSGSADNKYLYNGKELQEDAVGNGLLDWYDYGARMYDASLGRWHCSDPLAEKYLSISPYTYVANNPINFLDPDGARIDSTSQSEWNDLKGSVEKKHKRLNNRLQKRVEKGKNTKGLEKRVAHLGGTLNELHDMEVVQDVTYKLNNLGSDATVGFVEKDNTGNVVINYTNSVGNFVHEAKHGAQFLSGEIDFASSGKPIYLDLYDEVAAYKAEYAYTGSSNYNKVTTNWVYNLTDQKTGNSPYQAPYYSQFRINKNTNQYLFPILYPNIKFKKDFLNTIPLHLRLKK